MKEPLEKVEEYVYLGALSVFLFVGFVGVSIGYQGYIHLALAGGVIGGIIGFVLWRKAASKT